MTQTILLVDADARFLGLMARSLQAGAGWKILTATNATEALVAVTGNSCDAVVTDLRLPGANGALLLNEVVRRQPSAHRLILADLNDKQGVLKCIGTAHQFLAKPCEPGRLRRALERAFSFDLWLPGEAVRSLLSQLVKLPSPPNLFFQVVKELQSPNASIDGVAALISRDVAITAKLLQLVNSAAFALNQPLSNPAEAIMHAGLETTKSMVLLAHCFSYFEGVKQSDFSADELWRHSLRVSDLARVIARAEGLALDEVDEAGTAGMLHDLGRLALVANLPHQFSEAAALSRQENVTLAEAETRVFGASHAEVGAALMATWGLSADIVEALALHHSPARLLNHTFCALTAVHAANALDHALSSGAEPQWDQRYLSDLQLEERLPVWQELCAEKIKQLDLPAAV